MSTANAKWQNRVHRVSRIAYGTISFAFRNEDAGKFFSFGCDGREKGKVGFRVAIHVLMN
jgi:hypothetical protein